MGADLPIGAAFVAAYLLLFVFLAANYRVPGLQVAAVGIGLNTLAVILNARADAHLGQRLRGRGLHAGRADRRPVPLPDRLRHGGRVRVARAASSATWCRYPFPLIRDVVSIGDILLAMGIFWAIVYSMTRPEAPERALSTLAAATRTTRSQRRALATSTAAAGQTIAPLPAPSLVVATAAATVGAPAVRAERAQSPYLALIRNRNFSLLWIGQLISFFGDRIHQVALGVLLIEVGTPLDLGIALAMTAAPNVLLGPLAGALVDRWDRRMTMIVCDVVRAGLVLLVPLVVGISMWMVYAVAFAVATVGLLFRPAKNAVVPAIVREDQLVTANSASSINETIADLIGYPIAAAIVATLAGIIGAAFVLDAGTYLVSALLLYGMTRAGAGPGAGAVQRARHLARDGRGLAAS